MPIENLEGLLVDLTETVTGRHFGRYRGIVTTVGTGENLGRLRAKVPDLYGELESPWALPAAPIAGAGHGMLMLPRRDDGVWIECEAGDPGRPLWGASWWADGETPAGAGPEQRVLASPTGMRLVFDDDGKTLQLIHPDGATLTLASQEITLEIGAAKLVLSASGLEVNGGALKVSVS